MKKRDLIALICLLAVAVVFLVVSVILAHVHGVGLVAEWQSWFGIVKETTEPVAEAAKSVSNLMIK
ncbi:MAG: hypothetical protein J6K39_02860 [Clostridia bacterium]|nr:hypothetical protein [Clostridia bacterium]